MEFKAGSISALAAMALLTAILFVAPAYAAQGDIHAFAGIGLRGYSGDGGAATAARFGTPYGVFASGDGSVYISDSTNQRIRKVDPQGDVSTIAGDGKAGYSGDGGKATDAEIHDPAQLCMDAAGNLYFADSANNRVRRIDPSGTITTVAGTGKEGYSGDNGPAALASLNHPLGVAVDSQGGIYIADSANHCVRKVDQAGIVRAYVGTGEAGYSGDGGPATKAQLDYPAGLAVDAEDNLYIADYYRYCIRKVTPSGVITTFAGTGEAGYSGDGGPATAATLNYPSGVAAGPSGSIIIADRYNQSIRLVDGQGNIYTIAGGIAPDAYEVPAANGLSYPFSACFDKSGNIYIGDNNDFRVKMVEGPDYGLPASLIASPENGAEISGAVTVTGIASGPAGASSVEVSTDGGQSWEAASGTESWSYSWTPKESGVHTIISRATGSDGRTETLRSAVEVTVEGDNAPSLTPSAKNASPGDKVTWRASVPDGDRQSSYQFLRRGPDTAGLYVVARDWSTSPEWDWSASAANMGFNSVMVKAQGADGGEQVLVKGLSVAPRKGSTVKVTALDPDRKSASADTPVIWTARAEGGTGAYEYQFTRKGPDTGGKYVVERDWSALATWTFMPAYNMAGISSIRVNVRNSDGSGMVGSKEQPKYQVTSGRREPQQK